MCRFSKYTGAGNDFVLVRAEEVGLADASALSRRICPRSTGVGVDGLILVRSLSEDLVRVRFFNRDGSEFGTCGNGSRCAAHYALERGLVSAPTFSLVTDDGEVGVQVEDEWISLAYGIDASIEHELEVELAGSPRRAWLVRIGTPHLVVPVEFLPTEDFEELARPLRHHPALGAEGANVDLVRPIGPDAAEIRTFERGVEAETLACGSGAMAAAVVFRSTGLGGAHLALHTQSGAVLRVSLEPEAGGASREGCTIGLAGPAVHLFDGVFPEPTR